MQRLPSLCLLLLIPGTLPAEAASETEPKVVCSPSAPAVEFGGEIKLGAWARTAAGHRLTFRWSTDSARNNGPVKSTCLKLLKALFRKVPKT